MTATNLYPSSTHSACEDHISASTVGSDALTDPGSERLGSPFCATPTRDPSTPITSQFRGVNDDSWPSLRQSLGAIPTFTPFTPSSKQSTPTWEPAQTFTPFTPSSKQSTPTWEPAQSKQSTPTWEFPPQIPKVICTLNVDDEGRVSALLNVTDPPIPEFIPATTPTTSLRAGAKEFVPGSWASTPNTPPKLETPETPSALNPSACAFVSRVTPKMVPDEEVAFPDGCAEIVTTGDFTFNYFQQAQAASFTPPSGYMLGTQFPSPLSAQQQISNQLSGGGWVPFVPGQVMPAMVLANSRNIPPAWLQNEYKKDKLEDMPEPSTLNKTFPIKFLLAMREFFRKPSNDQIEIFLSNPLLKSKTSSMDKRIEENLLIRIASPPHDNETRYPSDAVPDPENWLPAHARQQYTPRQRKKWQKKKSGAATAEAPPEPPKETPLVEEAVFVKTLRTVLNKVTPENMEKMTEDLKKMGNPWSERFLELAVQHTHASVVTNCAFALVYASLLSNTLHDVLKDIDAFADRIVGQVRETLNLGGDPDKEPKSGLLLDASTKKVNSVALLSELYLTCLVGPEHIVSLMEDLLEAKSETVSRFRKVCLTCFVKLASITGNKLETEATPGITEAFAEAIRRIDEIKGAESLCGRMRFMVDDLFDLRKNEWASVRMAPEICPQKLDDNLKTYLQQHPEEKKAIKKAKARRSAGGSTPKSRPGTPRTPAKKKKKGSKTPRSKPANSRNSEPRAHRKAGKMSYNMACRTPANKKAAEKKEQIREKIEELVKGMKCDAIVKFAADHSSWRTLLIQRLLRKWRLAPFRAAVKKIVEALQGPSGSITSVELAEGFRLCSISRDAFSGKKEETRKDIVRSPSTPVKPKRLGLSARCSVRVDVEA